MDPPTPMGQYLGCVRRPFELEVDGCAVRGVEYDMEDDLRSKIDQHLDLVEKTAGQRPRITSAVVPFFPESFMRNRAATLLKKNLGKQRCTQLADIPLPRTTR